MKNIQNINPPESEDSIRDEFRPFLEKVAFILSRKSRPFHITNKITIIDFNNPCFIDYEPEKELFENYLKSDEYKFFIDHGGFRLFDNNTDEQIGFIKSISIEDNKLVTDELYLLKVPNYIGNFRIIPFGEVCDNKEEISAFYIRPVIELDIQAGFKGLF